MTLQTFFKRFVPPLEQEMMDVVQVTGEHYAPFIGMLHYHLGWVDDAFQPCQAHGGKRIRPVVCLLTCQACGGDWRQALPAGAAIELLHNFSLIHDDIEDDDRIRRGRATVWAIWGEAQGINTGDAMLAMAQLAGLRLAKRGVAPETTVAALELLNRTCISLTSGQFLDIGFEQRDDVSVDEYLSMIEGKTAALVSCSCEMGALVAGGTAGQQEILHRFGRHMGLGFQMRDDILGIWGDPEVTGKAAGADIQRRKKSLPILLGLERSEELRALFEKDSLSEADVEEAKAILTETGCLEDVENRERVHYDQAVAALDELDVEGGAVDALRELAEKLLHRNY